ncbi:MAG: hypothetical protein NTW46_03300, partial [Candidatus Nealsonbacteria bacterium]|nr:hypothetical protein [Candidatus Nealsonbacteria bacterium]
MPNNKLQKTGIKNRRRSLFLFVCVFSFFLLISFTNIPGYFNLLPKIESVRADAHATGGSGNWDSTTANAPWTSGVVPEAGDTVTIAAGHMVTIPAGVAAYAASIVISANNSGTQNGLTFAASNSTLTLTGAVTMAAATAAPGSLFAVDAGTLSGATTLALPGAGTGTWNTIFRISTGTANFSNTITLSGTAAQSQFTFTSNGRLNVGGNFTAGGTFTRSTGTINFTGGNTQTYGAYSYYNVEVNKTVGTAVGAASSNVTIPIGGNLTVTTGIFNIRRLTLTVTGTTTIDNGGVVDFVLLTTNNKIFVGRVTVKSGGTWQNTILTTLVVFREGITVDADGSFNHGNALATFNTNNQTLEGNGNMTFGGTVTVATGITLTNNNTATVTVTGALTFTGGWTQGPGSTLSYGSATILGNSGAGTFNANTNANIVNYTAAAPNCKVVVYSSLSFTGSGAITCATLATVNVNLTLSTAGAMTWTTG